MTFRARISRIQNFPPKCWRKIRNTFGLFEKLFLKEKGQKKPRNISGTVKFQGLYLRNKHQPAWLNLYISNKRTVVESCV